MDLADYEQVTIMNFGVPQVTEMVGFFLFYLGRNSELHATFQLVINFYWVLILSLLPYQDPYLSDI